MPTRSDLLESKPAGSTAISGVNALELQDLQKSDEQYGPHPRQEIEDRVEAGKCIADTDIDSRVLS
jgi:hypothetical protein